MITGYGKISLQVETSWTILIKNFTNIKLRLIYYYQLTRLIMTEIILFILTLNTSILVGALCYVVKQVKDIKMLEKSNDIKDYTLAKSIEKDIDEPSEEVIKAINKKDEVVEVPLFPRQ